jgi:NADPH:quinone reductase-like Zn-dependent oxidoreductase
MEGVEANAGPLVPATMKAWGYRRRFENKPDEVFPLEPLEQYPVPQKLRAGTMLVRVRAATINPVDWKVIGGAFKWAPTFMGGPPFDGHNGTIPCADGCGEVVLSTANEFPVGSEVSFDVGGSFGALAQYCVVPEGNATLKPKGLPPADAAANVGLASGTAVMGITWLLDKLKDAPRPLSFVVLGGGGGVGSAGEMPSLFSFVLLKCVSQPFAISSRWATT